MVHVAADTPESIAKRIADVGTFTSLFWVMDGCGKSPALLDLCEIARLP
jgi:hypothetical protein